MIETLRGLRKLRQAKVHSLSLAQGFLWILLIVTTAGAQSLAEQREAVPTNPYFLEAIRTAPYLIVAMIGIGHWWNAYYSIRHNIELQEAKLELTLRTQLLDVVYRCEHAECPLNRYRHMGNNLSVVTANRDAPSSPLTPAD
jgi:hypothetical protein